MLKKAVAPLALLAITALSLPAQEATLDEVLACHYETVGGLEAWQEVDALRMHGRMTLGPGMEAPFTVLNARPNRMRMEFSFQGMTGTQAYDGETGWQIMPFMGSPEPEEMPAEQVDALEQDSDLDGPLMGYEEEGIELEYLGVDDVEGTPAHKIGVTLKDGDEQTYFLDTDYCLPIRVEGEREVQGQTTQFVTILGDYKEVDGLVMPHSMESRAVGMPAAQVMTIDSVEVNPAFDPDTFTMPTSGQDNGGN